MDDLANLRSRVAAPDSTDHSPQVVLDVGSLASQLRLGHLSDALRVKGTYVAAEVWKKNPYFCFGSLPHCGRNQTQAIQYRGEA